MLQHLLAIAYTLANRRISYYSNKTCASCAYLNYRRIRDNIKILDAFCRPHLQQSTFVYDTITYAIRLVAILYLLE